MKLSVTKRVLTVFYARIDRTIILHTPLRICVIQAPRDYILNGRLENIVNAGMLKEDYLFTTHY